MATIYDIIEENNRIAKMQADLADFGKPFSEQKLELSIPKVEIYLQVDLITSNLVLALN